MMTDKQIIEQRQICLYQDTCLHLKEKTRVCEDCIHHKNYWSELLAKDQAEKIKNLEQECEELKNEYWKLEQGNDFLAEKNSKLKGCLTEIREIAEKAREDLYTCESIFYADDDLREILQKISEVKNG